MRSCPAAIRVTLVGELYCSPVCPAALSRGSRSAGGASGARKLVGNTRRSEEHTSELQSLTNLVCRLLLEKKKNKTLNAISTFCQWPDAIRKVLHPRHA